MHCVASEVFHCFFFSFLSFNSVLYVTVYLTAERKLYEILAGALAAVRPLTETAVG